MSLSFPLVPPSISFRKNPPVSCLGGWETCLCSSAASPPEGHSPVFILCLVTVSNLGFRVQSLSSQISAERVHMIAYWGGWWWGSGGRLADLSPVPYPVFHGALLSSLAFPAFCGVIGLLLVSISFGRQVCWGHPQLCQFNHCLSVTFSSFTLPLILHL